MAASKKVTFSDLFNKLPGPVVEIIRTSNDMLASGMLLQWLPFLKRLAELTLIYLLVSLDFGYGWILFLVTVAYVNPVAFQEASFGIYKECTEKAEENVMKETLGSYPSWVMFPDFDRLVEKCIFLLLNMPHSPCIKVA